MRRWLFVLIVCFALFLCGFRASAQTGDYDTLVHQGNAQLQDGNNGQALTKAKSAIKINAHRWEAYALAGGALMNLKRDEEAADNFSEAIQYAPEAKQDGLRNLRKQCLAAELGIAAPASSPQTATQPAATTQVEVVLWKTIENSSNPEDFQTYLSQYPNGAFAALANRHLNDLQQFVQQQRQLQQEQAKELDLDKTIWIIYPQLKGTPQDGWGAIWVFDSGNVYRRGFAVHLNDTKRPKHNKDDFSPQLADAKAVVSGRLELARFISGLVQTSTYATAAPANVTVSDKRDLDGCKGPGMVYSLTIDHGEMAGTYAREKGPSVTPWLNPFSSELGCSTENGKTTALTRLGKAGANDVALTDAWTSPVQ